MSVNLLAARAVARRVNDPAEARELLAMLGLLSDAGTIYADDAVEVSRVRSMPLESAAPRMRPTHDSFDRRPDQSTAPEALRNLPPAQPVQPPRKQWNGILPPRPAEKPCGTETAARRHVRNREPLCDLCANGRAARRSNPAEASNLGTTHGTKAGYQWHYRHHEKPCEACGEAFNKWRRDQRAKGLVNKPVADPRCGTTAGYSAHLSRNEVACPPCKGAERLRATARRAAKKATA